MFISLSLKLIAFIIIILKSTNTEKAITLVLHNIYISGLNINLGNGEGGKKGPSLFVFDVSILN